MELSAAFTLMETLSPRIVDLSGVGDIAFYYEINEFLREEIQEFQENLVSRMMKFFGFFAAVILMCWIWWQGFRIVTGRSRESLMGLVVDSLRATLVIFFATAVAAGSGPIYERMTEGLGSVIVGVVSNKTVAEGKDPVEELYEDMDKSLAVMSLALGSIEAVRVERNAEGDGAAAERDRTRSLYFAGIGTAGPAVTAGVMLTLNKIALALFVGLAPLFIMCLLFDQTKALFQRWLLYGIGTWFSLAVLYVMVILAMDLSLAVAGAFWVGEFINAATQQGINSMAMQQGGVGLILTMLLITAPGMAAAFFQGTLGQFIHYSMFDQNSKNVPSPHGSAGSGTAPRSTSAVLSDEVREASPRIPSMNHGIAQSAPQPTGIRGLAGNGT